MSVFQRSVGDFFTQTGHVTDVKDKMDFFTQICAEKRVLHIGCADAPIFDANNNLHIKLKDICKELHGLDVDQNALAKLSQACPGTYFSNYDEVLKSSYEYDVVLVPEVIEHVNNVEGFLHSIASISAKKRVITAPNVEGCYQCGFFGPNATEKHGMYKEIVHPDHNVWFSPYTLVNCIEKCTSTVVHEVFTLEHKRMVAAVY